jgi:hypothetical protein
VVHLDHMRWDMHGTRDGIQSSQQVRLTHVGKPSLALVAFGVATTASPGLGTRSLTIEDGTVVKIGCS